MRFLEKIFILIMLCFLAGAFLGITDPSKVAEADGPSPNSGTVKAEQMLHLQAEATVGESDKELLAMILILNGVAAFLIMTQLRDFLECSWQHKLLWLLLAWTIFSCLWATDPGFSIRRAVWLFASTCFGVYLAIRFTTKELLRLLFCLIVVTAVASVVAVWKYPAIGISGTENDAWRGIFLHKNTLGRLMAFGAIVSVFLAVEDKRWRLLYYFAFLACAALVLLAHSGSGAVTLVVVLSAMFVFKLLRSRSLSTVIVFLSGTALAMASVIFLVFDDFKAVFKALGKDQTLTGRTEIWMMVASKIAKRPWFGYGYNGFWLGMRGPSVDIIKTMHWNLPHSHNGYLDVILDVGLVGLLLFLIGFFMCVGKAIKWSRMTDTFSGFWPLAYLLFMFMYNLSESTILKDENLFWVLYVSTWVFLTTRIASRLQPAMPKRAILPSRPVVYELPIKA